MSTSPVIDIESLLVPVSEEQPAGPELRTGAAADQAAFHAVRDARKRASDAERRRRAFDLLSEEEKEMEPAAPDPPDWHLVEELTLAALHKSRDLWIVAWLIEALVRRHGYAGVRDGFRLAQGLCEHFWDHVHPRPGEGETLADTFVQLAGLNGVNAEGTLPAPLMAIPVTNHSGPREFSLADYLDAIDLERKDPDIRAERVAQGPATTEMIERAVRDSGADHCRNLLEDIDEAIAAFSGFNEWLAAKVADMPDGASILPPSSAIAERLAECKRLFRSLARELLAPEDAEDGETGVAVVEDGQPVSSVQRGCKLREEAFRALLQVADYFRRAEPHSPVSYALEQVVKWGRMSLPELLAELIEDSSARREIFRRTGIHVGEDED